MEVYFAATIGTCTEFMETGQKHKVSMTIYPIKADLDETHLKVTSGCNLWQACENKSCYFSLKARDKKKVKADKKKGSS